MGVPGVANVAIWGSATSSSRCRSTRERLRDKHVTLDQVIATAGNAQVVSPLSFLEASTPGTGGFIETPQQRLQVRHVFDKIADPDGAGQGAGRGHRRQPAPRRRRRRSSRTTSR